MKKLLAIASIVLFAFTHTVKAQEKCLTEIMFREKAAKNPQLWLERAKSDKYIREFTDLKKAGLFKTTSPALYIIPVVVHVIHTGGPENISKAQIEDQIRVLNEDFRRLNADTVDTPGPFKPLGADSNVEFRLAQLDPNGNCTEGITRYYTPLTTNARNNIKQFDYWPSSKYLNIWVTKSIINTTGIIGVVAGFAQFPYDAISDSLTDGVVINNQFMGTIGTANPSDGGRTTTHEVGHWLSLRHIWGDDGTSCLGSDSISDTPNQSTYTFSTCPTFPLLDACSPTSPGVMYSNYMDYTDGSCTNIFTQGQANAMEAVLFNSDWSRINLYSPGNLISTGTDGTPAVLCAPHADFIPRPKFVCTGSPVNFSQYSWGGTIDSRVWNFPGGTPATDTSANPVITYASAGVYDVSLTVTNSAGSDTKTVNGYVTVSDPPAPGGIPFLESFENGTFPLNDWFIINENGKAPWATTSAAASQGTKSIFLDNWTAVNGNDRANDEFITRAFDLSNVTQTNMTFDLAFAYKSAIGTNTDKLIVYYSTNCGTTWSPRKTIEGTTFQTTVNSIATNFIPNSTQWRNETVNLTPASISTKPNVRFRFDFYHDAGNNIYIDNININGTISGVDEINAENASVNIYPNPSGGITYVDFSMIKASHIKIDVMDVSGRLINTFEDDMSAGDHQYTMNSNLEKGVYMVRLTFGDNSITKKVVIK